MWYKNSLFLRTLSALVLVPVSLAGVYFGGAFFLVLVLPFFFVTLYEWCKLSFKTNFVYKVLISGLLYLILCYALFLHMRFLDNGLYYIFYLFFMVWSADIGAYFAGKFIGGAKCVPKISPNKTWAGVIGGILTALLVSHSYMLAYGPTGYNPASACFIAIFISFASMLGDLMVSALKRAADVKDTGNIIPGHGGVLDRIDSLILATPFMAYCIYWGLI